MTSRRVFFLTPGLAAATLRAAPKRREDLPTPALIVELDKLEANLAKMAGHLKSSGLAFRPHAKTHKTPEIAVMCQKAGAVGNCAAKLSEAAALAEGGATGLLVTTAVIGRNKILEGIQLAKKRPETIFCVDQTQNASDWDAAARAAGIRVNLALDLWVGRRTGIECGQPALELARHVSRLKNVRLQGLQAYSGPSSHRRGFEARVAATKEAMAGAVETRQLLERDGIPCSWLSGGSTGTWNIDPGIKGITELQPGSFLFMDIDYRRIGAAGSEEFLDFQHSLFVICTVVSQPKPDLAIFDGGYKAFAADRGYGPELRGRADVKVGFGGDEHGSLAASGAKVGDRLEFVVPHCDPTVNLYDTMYAVRGDTVEAAWRISARGRSQ
jgi:D-serine deaminase-like pyridoxal phosphate-dependent protein